MWLNPEVALSVPFKATSVCNHNISICILAQCHCTHFLIGCLAGWVGGWKNETDRAAPAQAIDVMGPWRGSLGASFVSADWKVRVFWLSGLIDRPSDRMYVLTIPMCGCMYRHSSYIPFSSQAWLAYHRKTRAFSASPEELSPYSGPFRGPPGTWKFQTTELPGVSPRPKQYPQSTGRLIN